VFAETANLNTLTEDNAKNLTLCNALICSRSNLLVSLYSVSPRVSGYAMQME